MTDENPTPEISPEDQAAMDMAVLDDMSFDAMSPRMHRKEAQDLIFCPKHGIGNALVPVLKASAGRSGMVTTEKIEALEAMRKGLTVALAEQIAKAVSHIDAAIEGYKAEIS